MRILSVCCAVRQLLNTFVLREQSISSCSKTLATFLLERDPKDLKEITRLAEQYIKAHRASSFSYERTNYRVATDDVRSAPQVAQRRSFPNVAPPSKNDKKCYECGRNGRFARDCFDRLKKPNRPYLRAQACLLQIQH